MVKILAQYEIGAMKVTYDVTYVSVTDVVVTKSISSFKYGENY